jgi:hypothetical protein
MTEPVAPDLSVALAVVDSSKLIREQLPQLDKPQGDKVPAIVEVRSAILKADTAKAARDVPKRAPK